MTHQPLMIIPRMLPALLVITLLTVFAGCSGDKKITRMPPRLLYADAESLVNQSLFSEAIEKFEQITREHPGTRLAAFAYLQLAEIYSRDEKWKEAETNYRIFLNLNRNTPFTPYLIYRLLKVNHENSFVGTIFKEREFDRDMEPNRKIILEYKRFFLLYPKSIYLKEITPFYRAANESLAQHELMVADFYSERGQHNAAIGRYLFLLRNFPEFSKNREALRKLIESYRKNNEPEHAEEMARIYHSQFDRETSRQSTRPAIQPAPSG